MVIGKHIIATKKVTTEHENCLRSKSKINGNSIMTFIGGFTGNAQAQCFLNLCFVCVLLIGIFVKFSIFSAAQLVAPVTAKAVSLNISVGENLEMFLCPCALMSSGILVSFQCFF